MVCLKLYGKTILKLFHREMFSFYLVCIQYGLDFGTYAQCICRVSRSMNSKSSHGKFFEVRNELWSNKSAEPSVDTCGSLDRCFLKLVYPTLRKNITCVSLSDYDAHQKKKQKFSIEM